MAKKLLERAREDFVKQRISRKFRNCCNNECSVARSLGKFHYCRIKTQIAEKTKIEKIFVCDSDEWATQCQEFNCKNTEKDAEVEFLKCISNPSRCGQLFPKLSALLWLLNDGKHADGALSDDINIKNSHGHEENEENIIEKESLWQRIRRVLLGGD